MITLLCTDENTCLLKLSTLQSVWLHLFIFILPACSSPFPYLIGTSLIGDGWCEDENNNAGCGFDGGDCCGPDVKTAYCSDCECLGENITSKAAPGPFCSCSLDGVLDCKLLICFYKFNWNKTNISVSLIKNCSKLQKWPFPLLVSTALK